jgi:hypothetical protein
MQLKYVVYNTRAAEMRGTRKRRLVDRNRHHEPTPRAHSTKPTPQGPQKISEPAYVSGQQQYKHTQTAQKSEHESTNTKYKSRSADLNLLSIMPLIPDFQQIRFLIDFFSFSTFCSFKFVGIPVKCPELFIFFDFDEENTPSSVG